MRAVLYDVTWQCVRLSCSGAYNERGGWGTVKGTNDNLQILDEYIHSVSRTGTERCLRLFRVINYLNAVRTGMKAQEKRTENPGQLLARFNRVGNFRDALLVQRKGIPSYRNDVRTAADYWDWDNQGAQLVRLYRTRPKLFNGLLEDLCRRYAVQGEPERTKPSTDMYREDLYNFLQLMFKAVENAKPKVVSN